MIISGVEGENISLKAGKRSCKGGSVILNLGFCEGSLRM